MEDKDAKFKEELNNTIFTVEDYELADMILEVVKKYYK